jgi:uncharacterized protein YecE (DUF72 family)
VSGGRGHQPPALRIGCSGWNYKAWKGAFYPQDLPASLWLTRYAEQFDTVEANSTFYRLPEAETFAAWADQTPPGFVMAVKASRYLTHMKKLRDPEAPLERLFDRVSALGSRLGPVLYQVPALLKFDRPRLERFLRVLPERLPGRCRRRGVPLRHVIEFRDPSWYVPDTFALLKEHQVAICLHDKRGSEVEEPQPGALLYVRFHGTSGHYAGSYGAAALARWARRLADAWTSGRDVYAYFNNDPDATATRNALSLRRRVEALLSGTRDPRDQARGTKDQ